nr:zinc knuckle CX2CX4HX4C [Tanacetum cinerariifolium]
MLVDEHGKQLEMKVTNKASASKPNTFMGDQLVESDEDEAELPDDETSRYMSSTGGGRYREDDLDFYDEYEAQVYDLPKQMHTFYEELSSDSERTFSVCAMKTMFTLIPDQNHYWTPSKLGPQQEALVHQYLS